MKSILALALLSSVVLAQVPQPFDFNWSDLRSIWESPRLQPAAQNFTSRYGINKSTNERGIVGGSPAREGQFPFHLLLVIDDMWWCGGSLLNANWALTAAHCIYLSHSTYMYSIVDINVGYYWMGQSAQSIVHEHYDDVNFDLGYDIGLIRSAQPAPNNAYTSYISLPRNHAGNSFAGYDATIQGFGVVNDTYPYVSEIKRYVTTPILDNANCYWRPYDNQLCADATGGRGSCNGDSGGSLFHGNANTHSADRIAVGIVSYGALAGCEVGYPVVYTRVTSFLDWIDRHIAA